MFFYDSFGVLESRHLTPLTLNCNAGLHFLVYKHAQSVKLEFWVAFFGIKACSERFALPV